MFFVKRSDNSLLSKWYFQIDKRIVLYISLLILIGIITLISAGPYAARRIGNSPMFFFNKYIIPALVGICAMFICSFFSKETIKKLSIIGLIGGLGLLLMTMVHPMVIKGSKRWIHLGMQIQPSEFLKPFWIVFVAGLLAKISDKVPGRFFKGIKSVGKEMGLLLGITVFILAILFLQPDFGMLLIYSVVLCIMFFLAGTSTKSCFVLCGVLVGFGCIAYLTLSHVQARVNEFFGLAEGADPYQIKQALDCIKHGGVFGQWGNGFVKTFLPDSHTDFVFATIVEDFGAIIATALLLLYFAIIYRVLRRMTTIKDKFTLLTLGGIVSVFAGQVFVNVATNLKLMPPKGMTLPFVSYGGSSFVAFCILFGFLLALLRVDSQSFKNKKENDNEKK